MTQVCSCEFCKIFKNNFPYKIGLMAASVDTGEQSITKKITKKSVAASLRNSIILRLPKRFQN